ncbi:hypothetical protein BK120_23230 [Paenibacillus sp. FSL A5-0031]|uniref:HD-GYP domain-containing protein n=1 Tax=Paenibacillus sp. FSL A5-0031 TaxID=1920420 RepID=UPI00097B2191|nr:HD domain-containing phosphohydrolase [Paenibacillus sp. FSL A5-0031]OME78655.1 hypothetical protein BK120_23230 [Paenibacillus sp. FSL A5-0031]
MKRVILTVQFTQEHIFIDELNTKWGGSFGDEKTDIAVLSLYRCLKIRDPITASHSLHMAELSYLLAQEFDKVNADLYFSGALTHDIGKLGMPDSILKGSERLSSDDRIHLLNHVADGYRLLNSLEMPRIILDIVRFHHERYDGSGYLLGLKGPEIPIAGRIAAIADTYSALTSNRLYTKALNKAEAISIMLLDKEKFDPEILSYFIKYINQAERVEII